MHSHGYTFAAARGIAWAMMLSGAIWLIIGGLVWAMGWM
jgi:hypothetical protein